MSVSVDAARAAGSAQVRGGKVVAAEVLPGLGRDGFAPSDRWASRNEGRAAFSVGRAAAAFGKGLVSPFRKVYEAFRRDPVMAALFTLGGALVIGAVVAPVVLAFPAAAPYVAGVLAAPGLWQLGKGAVSAVRNYRESRYAASEQAFAAVGEGAMKAALAAIPVLKLGRFARTPAGKSFGNGYLKSLAKASENMPKTYISPKDGSVSFMPVSFGKDGASFNLPIN